MCWPAPGGLGDGRCGRPSSRQGYHMPRHTWGASTADQGTAIPVAALTWRRRSSQSGARELWAPGEAAVPPQPPEFRPHPAVAPHCQPQQAPTGEHVSNQQLDSTRPGWWRIKSRRAPLQALTWAPGTWQHPCPLAAHSCPPPLLAGDRARRPLLVPPACTGTRRRRATGWPGSG